MALCFRDSNWLRPAPKTVPACGARGESQGRGVIYCPAAKAENNVKLLTEDRKRGKCCPRPVSGAPPALGYATSEMPREPQGRRQTFPLPGKEPRALLPTFVPKQKLNPGQPPRSCPPGSHLPSRFLGCGSPPWLLFEEEKEFKKLEMPQYVHIHTVENSLSHCSSRKPPLPMATRFHREHASLPGHPAPHIRPPQLLGRCRKHVGPRRSHGPGAAGRGLCSHL